MNNTVFAFINALNSGYKPTEDDECTFDCYIYNVHETGCPFEKSCKNNNSFACVKKRGELRNAYRRYIAKCNPDIPIEFSINDILAIKQFIDSPVDFIKHLPEDNILPVLRKIVRESALWENDK